MHIRITKNYGHLGHFPNYEVGKTKLVSRVEDHAVEKGLSVVTNLDDTRFAYPTDGLEIINPRPGMFSLCRAAVEASRSTSYSLVEISHDPEEGLGMNRVTPESRASQKALLVIQGGPNRGPKDEEWVVYSGRYIDSAVQGCLMTFKAQHVWYDQLQGNWAVGEGKPAGTKARNAWKLVATIRITPEGIRAVGTVLQP